MLFLLRNLKLFHYLKMTCINYSKSLIYWIPIVTCAYMRAICVCDMHVRYACAIYACATCYFCNFVMCVHLILMIYLWNTRSTTCKNFHVYACDKRLRYACKCAICVCDLQVQYVILWHASRTHLLACHNRNSIPMCSNVPCHILIYCFRGGGGGGGRKEGCLV